MEALKSSFRNISRFFESLFDIADFYKGFIEQIRADAVAFAELIIECCENAVRLLKEFRNFKKSEKLKDIVITLNDLEEKGDRLYAEAVRRLSREAQTTREVIEWRDIYRNCSSASCKQSLTRWRKTSKCYGSRDGYRLMTGRKHRPAVATSLRNKQPLARFHLVLELIHGRLVQDNSDIIFIQYG